MEDVELAQLFSALSDKCRRATCIRESRRLPDCTLSVLGLLERVIERRRIEGHSSHHRGRSSAQGNGRASPKRRTVYRCHGGWGMCLAFMVAYDVLVDLGALEAHDNVKEDKVGETKNIRIWEDDEIIEKALRVIELTREELGEGIEYSSGRNAKGSRQKPDKKSIVRKCFAIELKKIDAFVTSRRASRETDRVKLHSQTYAPKSNMESIWGGIDLDDEDDVSSEDPTLHAVDEAMKDERAARNKRKWEQSAEAPRNLACDQSNRAREPRVTNEDTTGGLETNLSPLDKSSVDLRTTLVNSMPGATQAEINSLAERVADLIQQGGAQGGAAGVARIGNILNWGIDGEISRQFPSTLQAQVDDIADIACSPLTEELIASVSKKYINRGTSAIRSSAYIRCFVVPLLFDLDESKPVPRTLMSTISWLARERAAETFSSLLIPVLCPSVEVEKTKRGVSANDTPAPIKALCDLAGRVVKPTKEKEAVAVLLSGLVLGESCSVLDGSRSGRMVWTDDSMPVMTACINKRACLSDATVAELSRQIQVLVSRLSKSMKFSALFHAFVTKYGHQLRTLSVVDELSQSAERLQTFMGKTIISVLKKL
mmetsp:Transcript_42425/g.128740  ORF Transcript_42425/g.128740 Transcript_42425/m.128740 type:complete len:599 (-) Transcript_42425:177-1973(-)